MKTLKFKTDIKCSGCLAKVTPHLNELKGITKWSVDTLNPDKILTVETENTSAEEVVSAVNAAGYKATALSE